MRAAALLLALALLVASPAPPAVLERYLADAPRGALGGRPGGPAHPLTMSALAVAYDRDEQISLAGSALARIVGQGNGNDQLMNVLFDGNLAPDPRLRGPAPAASRPGPHPSSSGSPRIRLSAGRTLEGAP